MTMGQEGSSGGLDGRLGGDAALAGHVFYDRLQSVLIEGGFDEASCRPYYAARMGAPSVPPGRYFAPGGLLRISERGWRCSDSLSLRELESLPDHLAVARPRHTAIFT